MSTTNATTSGFPEPLQSNIQKVLLAMQANGIAQIKATYSGGGDSGQCDAVNAVATDGTESDLPAIKITQHRRLDYTKKEASDVDMTLGDAAESILWDVVEHNGFSGWENNEGGYGELCIDSDGVVHLDHSNYVQSTEDYSYEHRVLLPSEPETPFDSNLLVAQLPRSEPALNL